MTEPHANPEDLDLYALGALEGEEKQRFETHLRACPSCQRNPPLHDSAQHCWDWLRRRSFCRPL